MFMSDVSIIVRKMRTMADRKAASLGVGFPEQLVLMYLKFHGSSNQESIAAEIDIDRGAIAKTIAKLEEKGLVKRQVNQKNKREKIVELLPLSSGIIEAMRSNYEEVERVLFAGFSEEEKLQACAFLARISENATK